MATAIDTREVGPECTKRGIKFSMLFNDHLSEVQDVTNGLILELASFKQSLHSDDAPSPSLAKSTLVIMVRGLFSNLKFAYAQFPCSSLTGDKLFSPFWNAVCRLENCGFKVMLNFLRITFTRGL